MSEGYSHTFHLLDKNVVMWSQFDRPLGRPYPNLLWTPGEVFSDTYPLDIGPRTPPGLYDIEFSVYHLVDGNFDFLPISLPDKPEPDPHYILGKVRVLDRAHNQPPQQPLVANLGDQIQLTGFDLTNEQLSHDQPFQFALHWQAINPQQADYTVFTQLIGPDGQVWAQQDNQPQGGNFPTTLWAPQDPVIDRYSLSLSDGAPPGQYRLLIGMYDLSTGQRLPTFTPDGQPVPDNAIQVAVLPLD
jgi:hypothetical protein